MEGKKKMPNRERERDLSASVNVCAGVCERQREMRRRRY